MSIIISSCLVKSEHHESFPNGELVASGTVSYFLNTKPYNEYTQTLITKVSVTNINGVQFFGDDRTEYSASALRAIADALIELANRAEDAHTKLIELNQTD
jgi:hypothetical protein